MSKKKKDKKPMKDRWVLQFILFAIVLLAIAIACGHSVPALPNILAVIYIVAGVVWFIIHTKVSAHK